MKNLKKIFLAGLAVVVAITSAGCSGGKEQVSIDSGSGEIPESLTIFANIAPNALKAGAKDNNDTLYFQLMEEHTGCHVEWIHPASGATDEKFNLIIASGNLPDMMVYNWSGVAGGAKSFAENEVIIPLKDLIKENMPNLSAYMEENPHIAKQFMDDSGEIYYIPFIRKDEQLKVYQGPQIRKDWLDKLGLEQPETPEELYEVLKAFKTQDPNGNGKADEIPMSGVKFENTSQAVGNLLWMFGTTNDFYIEKGKVKYGVMEDSYEEGIKYISKLYKEGLIDKDYLVNDRSKMDGKFMNNQVGFVYSLQPGNYYTNMNGSGAEVIGIKHPAAKGVANNVFDAAYVQDATGTSIAITTANKNPAGSLKWLDQFYGEEGVTIMNYGKEGLTFEYNEEGFPEFTDYIFNNPDGKNLQEIGAVSLGTYQSSFPTLQEWNYYEQILTPWGKDSIENWSSSAKIEGIMPSLSFTEEETETITQNMSQIQTYVSEKVNKIVIGNADVSELSEIRERVKKMGIEEVIEIYENALERYNNR